MRLTALLFVLSCGGTGASAECHPNLAGESSIQLEACTPQAEALSYETCIQECSGYEDHACWVVCTCCAQGALDACGQHEALCPR